MTPEHWQRINDLFGEACRLPSAARQAFLNQACAGDAALRSAVAALLEQDEQAEQDGFLAVPCPLRQTFQQEAPAAALVGRRVGPYEIRERVGGGGMGDVYRAARVDDYRQEVALKVIKRGLDTEEARQRFRTERQVLADLQHPGIARLLDGGTTDDGLPYLVLEYIAGLPIDRHCDAGQLDVRARLQLLHTVCLAVQYAHDHHVIHRDLKPANVLLSLGGRSENGASRSLAPFSERALEGLMPKITDFGLAKYAAEDAGQTQTGAVLGTPSYMAPEQAAGRVHEVCPASDVYALGAILYELLTGRPPFKGTSLRDTLEQVCSHEPVPPRQLQPALPRDLDTICLKCLQKEPGKRYPTAAALADDLKRFLNGEPIHARPVGRVERLGRWCRRNPRVAGLLLVLAVVIGAGFTGVTGLWLLARAEKQEANRQRQRAEDNEKVAWQAMDDVTRVAEDWLATEPRMSDTQLQLLEKALAYRRQFVSEHRTDATARFKTAQAYHFVARLRTQMGRPAQAVEAFRRQIALLDELAAEFPTEPKYRFDLFHSYKELAFALDHVGEDGEAEAVARRALACIQDLVRDYPGQPLYRDALAHQHVYVGGFRIAEGDPQGAAAEFQEGLRVAQALVDEFPNRRDPPAFAANVAGGLLALAGLAASQGQTAEAESYYRRALEVMRRVAVEYPNEPAYRMNVALIPVRLAGLLCETGRPAEAEKLLHQALPLCNQLARDFPGMWGYCNGPMGVLYGLGQVYQATGRPEEAAKAYHQVLALDEKLATDFPDFAPATAQLASFLVTCPDSRLRDPARAVTLARRALALAPGETGYRLSLGIACYRAADYPGCVSVLEKEALSRDPAAVSSRFYLAMARWQLGDRDGARRDYDQTLRALAALPWRSQDLNAIRAEAEELLETRPSAP
jgi:serine/threonine protein kinase/tetratricopeptide (TPR) repeat protein